MNQPSVNCQPASTLVSFPKLMSEPGISGPPMDRLEFDDEDRKDEEEEDLARSHSALPVVRSVGLGSAGSMQSSAVGVGSRATPHSYARKDRQAQTELPAPGCAVQVVADPFDLDSEVTR